MLFPTFDFLLFVVPVLLVAWALAGRPLARVLFLLVASYFFYVAAPKTPVLPAPWYFVGLLLFSTALDFVCGLEIQRRTALLDSDDPAKAAVARRARNAFLTLSVVGNLGLLFYFKYTDFFVDTATDVANALGAGWATPHLDTLLPLGISFYTFQSLSYTIDVWRGRLEAERSLPRFALFVSFFPQLVAGPIVRASELLPQIHRGPRFDALRMEEGIFRIGKGLIKKVVLGDFIAGQFTDAVFSTPDAYTSPEIMLALYAFTVQLYADFSGYSDIAIGVSRLLGYDIPENFDRPYQARNIGEFWRRWHMTLSTWLRDYLFFPLGGSRGGTSRTYFNLWLTMFLVGMWHYRTGTSWNFVLYANLHGLAMLYNRWNRTRDREVSRGRKLVTWPLLMTVVALGMAAAGRFILDLPVEIAIGLGAFAAVVWLVVTALPVTGGRFNTVLHVALTFHFTVLSRIFFRAEDWPTAKRMCAGLLSFDGHGLRPGLLAPEVWALLAVGLAYHFTPKRWIDLYLFQWFRRVPGPLLGVAFALIAWGIMELLGSGPRSFIYFQF